MVERNIVTGTPASDDGFTEFLVVQAGRVGRLPKDQVPAAGGSAGPSSLALVADSTDRLAMVPAERTKLQSVEAGAQVNPANLDGVADSTSRVAMVPAERTKLQGVEDGAQVNPANLDGVADSTARLAMTQAERDKLTSVAPGAQVNPSSLDSLGDGSSRKAVTAAQADALAGTAGTPGSGNRYATQQTTDALAAAAAAHLAAVNPHTQYTTPADVDARIAAAAGTLVGVGAGWTFHTDAVVTVNVTGQPSAPSAAELLTIGGGPLQLPANLLGYDNAQVKLTIEGDSRVAAGANGNDNASPTTWSATLTVGINGTNHVQDGLPTVNFATGDVPWSLELLLTRRAGSFLDLKATFQRQASASTPPAIGDGGNISGSPSPSSPYLWDYSISGIDFGAAIALNATIGAPNMSTWTIPTISPWSGSAATETMFRWRRTKIDGRMMGAGPQGAAGPAAGAVAAIRQAGAAVSASSEVIVVTSADATVTLPPIADTAIARWVKYDAATGTCIIVPTTTLTDVVTGWTAGGQAIAPAAWPATLPQSGVNRLMLSAWLDFVSPGNSGQTFFTSYSTSSPLAPRADFGIRNFSSTGEFGFFAYDSGGVTLAKVATTQLPAAGRHHVLIAFDAVAGSAWMYIDGVKKTISTIIPADYTIDWGNPTLTQGGKAYLTAGARIGEATSGWQGGIGQLWLAVGSVLPDAPATLAKFYNVGSPAAPAVSLGADGTAPGINPAVYLNAAYTGPINNLAPAAGETWTNVGSGAQISALATPFPQAAVGASVGGSPNVQLLPGEFVHLVTESSAGIIQQRWTVMRYQAPQVVTNPAAIVLPFRNAMDYQPDRTRATSSQAALQAALNSAAIYRETVFLPAGRFKVISLVIPRGVILEGQAPFATIISQDEVALAADGGDSMIDALANGVQAVAKSDADGNYWGFTLYPPTGASPSGYMKISGKTAFAVPRQIAVSSATGASDISDLQFQVRGQCPDFISATNTTGIIAEEFNGPENGGDPNTANNRGTTFSKCVYTGGIEVRLINTPAPTNAQVAAAAVAPMMGARTVHIGIVPPPMVRLEQVDQKNPGIRNIGLAATADASPFYASRPVLVRDACAIQLSVEGKSLNAPLIDNVYITSCMRGISLYGGIKDSGEPGQKYGIANIEIQCGNSIAIPERPADSDPLAPSYRPAFPPSTTMLNLACGFYIRGQVDTPSTWNTNVKGWDDGGGQTEAGLNSIGYWWPTSRLLGAAKGGSGAVMHACQTRFTKYGFVMGEGQIRSASICGDFENAHTLMWVGKNNKAIKIGGGFAHPGGYQGFPGAVFHVESDSDVTVDYGMFEGSYQGNPFFCEGAGRLHFGDAVRFNSGGGEPKIPIFNMDVPAVGRYPGNSAVTPAIPAKPNRLYLTNWSDYGRATSTEAVTDVQCFIPPGRMMTLTLAGATTFQEADVGNLLVAIGTGTPGARSIAYSRQVTLQAMAYPTVVGGSGSQKTVMVISGA